MAYQATYVLPLRWRHQQPLDEMTAYLRLLSAYLEVIVVDASPPEVFEHHHRAWQDLVAHVRPDPDLRFTFGKVNGVLTGVRLASNEAVIVADDDVRYDEQSLLLVVDLLGRFDIVRPQNYFHPLPWHARWDTARTLINRAVGRDWPGTLGVRRSTLVAVGGYDGDVLFENLELVRTVLAAGGSHVAPLDLFVRRLPPTARHFMSQRVRQAYDEFARPPLLIAALVMLPGAAAMVARRRLDILVAGSALSVCIAEAGRWRKSGTRVFPFSSSLLAPCWLAERALCSWLALGQRLILGGVRYGDVVIARAATPPRELRRRMADCDRVAHGGVSHVRRAGAT